MEKQPNKIPYTHCMNCGEELKGMYCHVCGQEATSKTPTIGGFVLEYLNNAFIWDPKFFKTLWTLVRRPGHLTKEFLSGKFISQEHPLKLNMFLLFVFITLFVIFSKTNSLEEITEDETVYSAIKIGLMTEDQEYLNKLKESKQDTIVLVAPLLLAENFPELIINLQTIEDTEGEGLDKWKAALPHLLIEEKVLVPDNNGIYHFNTEEKLAENELKAVYSIWDELMNLISTYLPMLVLFTAPLLTMSVGLVQRRKKLPRIHHFIFALHYTAFIELMILVIYILYLTVAPPMQYMDKIVIICSCLYLTFAFKNAYDNSSWFKSFLKALVISLIYLIICIFILVIILIAACILAIVL